MPIHFGTDGWRAVISDTFLFHNLRLVGQAIADAVGSEHWLNDNIDVTNVDPHKMVVGYDTRFLSDRYAVDMARVLAANGYKVLLSQSDAPTPVISFTVRHQGAIGGVMITASHNAPRYNGVKLKAAYGGSALPEQCRRVEVYLNDNESRGRGPNQMDFEQARQAGLIQRYNPLPAYYDHLRKLINFDLIAENPQRVVVDSMYGSGRGVIKGILQGTGCEVQEIRAELNPGFGGVHPRTSSRYLGALASAISMGMGDLGLVTDGDADRIGAMDGRGNFIDPHKIMALSLRYLVEKRGWRGPVIRTVSTTSMIDRLAQRYELPMYETPEGFNHIADYMLKGDVLMGGEESGGISFHGHIPEAPDEIGGEKVSGISTIDGVKYQIADGSWMLIRPSGTEPVLRVYAEGRTPQMVAALLGYGEKVATQVS